MKLTRDNGASPLDQWSTLRNEINRLFDLPWNDVTPTSQLFDEGWVPAVDVFEDRDNLIVKAELPGLSKEAIDIHLHDGSLLSQALPKAEEAKPRQIQVNVS